MKKFFLKLFFLLFLVCSYFVFLVTQADGYTDTYYLKLTTPKQQALILGNSKALHGMNPYVLDSVLQPVYPGQQLFNYAFSLGHSPYGPVYYNAILKKLDTNTKRGLFILTVDPWSVSAKKGNPNDASTFVEKELFLGSTKFFNANPNLDYLLRGYQGAWGSIIFRKLKSEKGPGFLHKNGWLEINIKWDSLAAEGFMSVMENTYKNQYLPATEPSVLRLAYLEKTIQKLKNYGDVYLVRMPVHERLKQIDHQLMPEFDLVMEQLSNKYNIRYFNFIDSSLGYRFNDGVHLHLSSGKNFSVQLATLIQKDKM